MSHVALVFLPWLCNQANEANSSTHPFFNAWAPSSLESSLSWQQLMSVSVIFFVFLLGLNWQLIWSFVWCTLVCKKKCCPQYLLRGMSASCVFLESWVHSKCPFTFHPLLLGMIRYLRPGARKFVILSFLSSSFEFQSWLTLMHKTMVYDAPNVLRV